MVGDMLDTDLNGVDKHFSVKYSFGKENSEEEIHYNCTEVVPDMVKVADWDMCNEVHRSNILLTKSLGLELWTWEPNIPILSHKKHKFNVDFFKCFERSSKKVPPDLKRKNNENTEEEFLDLLQGIHRQGQENINTFIVDKIKWTSDHQQVFLILYG